MGLREDRQPRDGERQVARAIALEAVAHGVGVQHVAGLDIVDGDADALMALGRQQAETVTDIISGQRRAVAELRLGAERECHALAVIGNVGVLRDKPIDRIRLVHRAHHQRVEEKVQALCRVTLEDVGVETVEGVHRRRTDGGHPAALRRIWIRIIEMGEVSRILEVAEGGDAVARCRPRRSSAKTDSDHRRSDMPHFAATFFAFSSSHHQMLGKPVVRSGSFSGRPKRSHRAVRS